VSSYNNKEGSNSNDEPATVKKKGSWPPRIDSRREPEELSLAVYYPPQTVANRPAKGDRYTAVNTPRGEELVDRQWCDEPTKVMSAEQLAGLINDARASAELGRHLAAALSPTSFRRKSTAKSMRAVQLPKQAPADPVIEVIEVPYSRRYGLR
jgi:hypothetical protein